MWACVPECIFGLEWTGMLPTQPERPSCQFAVTSALESRNNFGCTFSNERRNDESQAVLTCAAFRLHACTRIASANQAHRNARRGHDLKLLSIRCEATPGTPVWRSKRGSQLDRWQGRNHAKRGWAD